MKFDLTFEPNEVVSMCALTGLMIVVFFWVPSCMADWDQDRQQARYLQQQEHAHQDATRNKTTPPTL